MANGCSFPYLTTALVVAALLSGIRAWQNQCGHSPQMVSARTYIAGVIESPNYQNQYPNNTNCQWKIVARQGYIVRLYVVDMDLEEDSHCSYDSVSIFDGGSKMKHSRLAKICGQNYQYHNFYSTGRYMYIDFTSDGSITKRGFQLRYKAIVSSRSNYSSSSTTTTTTTTTPRSSGGQCHSSMTYPLHASPGVTRSIYSPNYPNEYPRNLNCGWKIVASWGYVVRLYVAHVDFEECDNCTFDSVSVFDGVWPQHRSLLAKFCHDSDQGRRFYSSGRYMYVKFTSDGSVSRSGFQLNYKAVLSSQNHDHRTTTTTPASSSGQCHSSMTDPLRASPGVTRSIYSPNYPNEYPSNTICGWKIEARRGYVVRLYVAQIVLEESDDCTYDSVSVFDGERPLHSQLLAELCHFSDQGRVFYSTGRYMFVNFTSDGSVTGSGFQLNYKAVLESPGDYDSTTTRPWWHRTTTADRYSSTYRHHSGALIGGLSAGLAVGLALLFAIVLLCRRRIKQSRNRPHALMRHATPSLNPAKSTGMAYRNNAVFMMPNVGYVSPMTGCNNFGYSLYRDGLSAYSTLLPNTYLKPGGVAGPSDATAAPPGESTEPAEPAQPSEPIGASNAMAAQPDETDGPPNTVAAQPGSPAGPSSTMAAQLGVPAMPSNAMAAQPSTQVASPPPAYSDALMDSHPPATPNSEQTPLIY